MHIESIDEKNGENIFIAQDLVVPTNTTEALKDPIWRPPPDTNIVGSRWTHICKHNDDRTPRAKSRVVAQGFTQTFGVDYDETCTSQSTVVFAHYMRNCGQKRLANSSNGRL